MKAREIGRNNVEPTRGMKYANRQQMRNYKEAGSSMTQEDKKDGDIYRERDKEGRQAIGGSINN